MSRERMTDVIEAVLMEEHLKGKLSKGVMQWYLPDLHHLAIALEDQEGFIKVTRCKDCKEWFEQEWSSDVDVDGVESRYCPWHDSRVDATDFCNHGEPKEEV